MVLVFVLLGIIIFLLLIFTILIFSTIQIEIKNLKIGNKQIEENTRIKDKFEIKISLKFLKKIPILWMKLNNKKMRKMYNSKQLEKIDFKKLQNKVPLNMQSLEMIKNIKIKISKLKLRIDIGTEDAVLTSYIIAILASIIGIILPHLAKKNINDCNYIVNPKYQNKNEYHISLDGIICIKVVHIIYSMLVFIKKGRDKNERTSNRRPYAYSNE
jgi:hypothetical protein